MTYFIDLDGTLLKQGTNTLTDGAQQFLDLVKQRGDNLVITTRRGDVEFKGHPVYSREATIRALRELRLNYHEIVFDAPSPRILIDDQVCRAFTVRHNEGIKDFVEFWTKELAPKEEVKNDV
jgi:hypothetical protein